MRLRLKKNSEKQCFSRSKQCGKLAASAQIKEVETKSGRAMGKAKASEAEEAGHPQAEKLLPNLSLMLSLPHDQRK